MSVRPHSTLLRRGVLLCETEAALPDDEASVVAIGDDGICPKHGDGACATWFIPWADARSGGAS